MNALRETEKAIASTLHEAWRIIILVFGGSVVLIGAALIILPGPGWLTIILGLAILGSEFIWARRLLRKARREMRSIEQNLRKTVLNTKRESWRANARRNPRNFKNRIFLRAVKDSRP